MSRTDTRLHDRTDPRPPGSSPAERVLELHDGVRLSYAVQGPVSAPTLLLVHGWPDSWRSFEWVMQHLPADDATGLRVVAVSLRGFGNSDHPSAGCIPARFAADLIELIERLQLPPLVLVGHSMGSMVSELIALGRPDLVRGLVLIGGFAAVEQELAAEVLAAVDELDDPVDETFVRAFQGSTLAAPLPSGRFAQIVAESSKAPAAVWRTSFAAVAATDLRADLDRIAAPTLLLWGEHDALISRHHQDLLLERIPTARLEVLDGAGHSPNWEQPARVASALEAFTRALP